MTRTITETMRLEVVKPLSAEWDVFGRMLRAFRAPLHRVLNNAITDVEISHRSGSTDHPQTVGYRRIRALWEEERSEARRRVEKRKPYTGDEAISELEPSSALALGASGAIWTRWSNWKKEKWRGDSSLPTFKAPSPLYVAGAGVEIRPESGLAVLSLNLLAGRGKATDIVVRPYGGLGFAQLSRIFGGAKLGDCRLKEEEDRDGKRKWQALVSYTYEAEDQEHGSTMALHRGVKCFLTAAIASGSKDAYTTVLETGEDILAHKARYQARRRSMGRQQRQLGAGAKGHGHSRRFENITKIEGSEESWVRSKCQEVAAHAIKLAIKRNVSRILIEDWTNPASAGAPELGEFVERMIRRFPLAQLRSSIEWAAKKAGLQVEVVAGAYQSRRCPKCSTAHDSPPVDNHVFRCSTCWLERNVDAIAAWNMLARVGLEPPIAEAIDADKKAMGKLQSRKRRRPAAPKREGLGGGQLTGTAREGGAPENPEESIPCIAKPASEGLTHGSDCSREVGARDGEKKKRKSRKIDPVLSQEESNQ